VLRVRSPLCGLIGFREAACKDSRFVGVAQTFYVGAVIGVDKSQLRDGKKNREPFRSRFVFYDFFVFIDLQMEVMQDPVQDRRDHHARRYKNDHSSEQGIK
jgi:hypothetical protein